MCLVLPQAKCVCTFVVPMGEQPFLEEFIHKYASLWETLNHVPHFKVNEIIEGMFAQIVLFDNPSWEIFNGIFIYSK
jgi:hypothetical protein